MIILPLSNGFRSKLGERKWWHYSRPWGLWERGLIELSSMVVARVVLLAVYVVAVSISEREKAP